MKLEYTILWVENDPETIKLKSPGIKKYLDDLGFTMKIIPKEDDKGLIQLIKDLDINLVLVDYNLQENKKGDEVINAIRRNKLYNEVVFYSVGPFRNRILKQLEGVFYANLDGLVDKTKAIIDITLKKNQDIGNIRGLFIAETTDLTKQMEEVISKILCLSGEPLNFFTDQVVQEEFFNDFAKYKIIKRFLNQKIESLKKRIPDSKEPEQTKLKDLQRQVQTVDEEFGHFQKEIIELRNELAHSKKSDNGRNILCVRNKNNGCIEEKLFDETKCQEIRKNFLKHSKKLEEIAGLLDQLKNIEFIQQNPKAV